MAADGAADYQIPMPIASKTGPKTEIEWQTSK